MRMRSPSTRRMNARSAPSSSSAVSSTSPSASSSSGSASARSPNCRSTLASRTRASTTRCARAFSIATASARLIASSVASVSGATSSFSKNGTVKIPTSRSALSGMTSTRRTASVRATSSVGWFSRGSPRSIMRALPAR